MVQLVTQQRIEAKGTTGKVIGGDQFGFVKERGTCEVIGSLRRLTERRMEHGKQLRVCFVDYEKAFDHVNWSVLMTTLKQMMRAERDRWFIKNLYTKREAVVRLGDVYSKSCTVSHGTRQGCPLPPLLLNILFLTFYFIVYCVPVCMTVFMWLFYFRLWLPKHTQ